MEIRLIRIRIGELWQYLEPFAQRLAIAILFGGDRLACCDEAFIAMEGDEFAGCLTISPEGEMRSGEPTIVGLWVRPEYRRRGVGTRLMEAAVKRMLERGLTPIRVDVMSEKAMGVIERLPEELKNLLVVNEQFDIPGLSAIEPLLDL